MTKIKKLFIYSISIIGFFSLMAAACENPLEDIAVDVPTTIEETFTMQINEAGEYAVTKEVDMSSPEIQEYRDKIKSFTAESLSFEVTDNIEGGSAISNSTEASFIFGDNKVVFPQGNQDLKSYLERINLSTAERLKSILEQYVVNPASASDSKIDMEVSGNAQGPIDLTVKLTITGIIEASAN